MSVPRPRDASLRALVLTAGLGTRLEPLTYIRAKAAVPVNGETLVRRVIRWLLSHDVRDLVLNLHHLPATITASIGDGSDLGAHVRYSWENPVLGSAGGPRHALPLLVDPHPLNERGAGAVGSQVPAASRQSPFLIVNGDTLTDVDPLSVLATHIDSGAAITMALIPNPRPDKYGGVIVSDDRWVTGFTRAGSSVTSYHFIGVQVAEARAFAELADGVPAETVNDLYPRMIASDRRSVGAFICDASFRDIGTPADYLETSRHLAQLEGDRMTAGRRVHIGPSASVIQSAVWDDVTISAGAELVECIVCDGVVVPAGARYRRCAIVPAGGRAPKAGQRVEGGLLVAPF